MLGSTAISLVNAGVEAFVRAAALEMPRGIRLNAVSPPWVRETLVAMGREGANGMPAAQVATAYVASVESHRHGEVIDAREFQ
jgi:NAD(P)-dependent dehydrogenase (short-subunit alcohol dehydrogenase family)